MSFQNAFRALDSRNYRLFFAGQCISLIGNWMTTTASLWLVYHLSENAFFVGLVGFANQIPVFILSPLTGVWVDRLNRHRLLIALQALSFVQSAALAVCTFTGAINVPWLLGLCLCQGLINAWEFPGRQAFLLQMIEKRENLPSAIALGSSLFNLARLTGPAMAGFVIAKWGPAVCFTVDALSFLPVIAGLCAMQITRQPPRGVEKHPLTDLREGLSYAYRTPALRSILLLVPLIALTGFVHSVLAPVFARDIFHGDSRLLGFMFSSVGVGALAGALALSARATVSGLDNVIVQGAVILSLGLLTFAASPWLALSLLGLTAAGYGAVRVMASSNTLVQSLVDDDKRGRVMGLFTMGQGMFPIGSLLIGASAQLIGPRWTVAWCGAVCLAAGWHFRQTIKSVQHPRTAI